MPPDRPAHTTHVAGGCRSDVGFLPSFVVQPTAGMANRSDRIISSSFIERLDGRKILEALLEIVARRARGGGQACLSHNGSFVIRVYSRLCQAFPIQPVG